MKNKPNIGMSKENIKDLLTKIGEKYGFYVETEVHTGFSKVDLVWFDNRIKPVWLKGKKKLVKSLAIPIVGFEIEEKTDDRKIIRGDIESLNSLSPIFGVLVFSDRIKNFTIYRAREKSVRSKFKESTEVEIINESMKKAEQYWKTTLSTFEKYAEANQKCRIIVFEEKDLYKLAKVEDL